jgi:hypothetical protein
MGDFGQGDALPLSRELSSQSDEYAGQFDMSPGSVAARAAAERERSRIASEVAGRSPGAASGSADDNGDLQFPFDGGKKRTKKRSYKKSKRSYKKSKRSYKKSKKSYKKSKRSYKKSKRGGATAPITFTIVKLNSDDPLLVVQLQPNQTGKDLYEQVNQWLGQNPHMLTDAEKVGERKLVTDNDVIVKYDNNLSMFQPRTKLVLSIIPEGSGIPHGRGWGPEHPAALPPPAVA